MDGGEGGNRAAERSLMEPPEYKNSAWAWKQEALCTVIRLSYFPAAYLTYVVRQRWPRSKQKHKDSHTSQKARPNTRRSGTASRMPTRR